MDADTATGELVGGRLVLLAGGTSAAGRTCARALVDAGARVVVVGSDAERLAAVRSALPGVAVERSDLTDESAVIAMRERVHAVHGTVDGVLHLV
ncbi:alcohol dehydrogenase, partial [Microbacterium sp. HMWF026]|uniref:SDR family NAD(P)-dependent oxidoreductase n=1 Tax=Microbacterium sp. HMWF026 TaxID=2056861 RepID=UPI000D4E25AA